MRMKRITKATMPLAALAGIALAATSANAAAISHLGNYINYGDGWRSTGDPDKDGGGGVANSDPNGDNAWGSDGYYVARASAVASSLPAYITSVGDNRLGISNEVTYDDATLAIANDVADAPGVAFLNATPLIFTFTLAQDATFVLTAIFDTATTPSYYVEGITVDGPTASDDTTGLSGDETVDYAFFEVSGEAGDVFTVTVANSNSNYAMSGLGFEAVPETGVAITEITSVGGGTWELTLEGEASTGYEFRSSPILDFDPGALVINLTQGAPGDPGDISGTNDSVLTTDGNGDGTVRMMLAGPANFVRAQIPPPLLEEDFEGLAGLPADWSASDNGALTAWSVDTPNGTGTEPDAAANGTQCAGTNMNGDYTASAVASIITKAFTVPASGATLSFSQYIDTETAPSGDLGSIRLLNAGDDSVLAGGDVATGLEGITEAWSSQTLPLPAAANGLSVKLEFSFESDADGDLFAGFYIDDVVVTQTTP